MHSVFVGCRGQELFCVRKSRQYWHDLHRHVMGVTLRIGNLNFYTKNCRNLLVCQRLFLYRHCFAARTGDRLAVAGVWAHQAP